MVGREVTSIYSREPLPAGPELLRVEGLRAGVLHDISFALRAGEIVGMAGLVGAGRTELVPGAFRSRPIDSDAFSWRANRWICAIPLTRWRRESR